MSLLSLCNGYIIIYTDVTHFHLNTTAHTIFRYSAQLAHFKKLHTYMCKYVCNLLKCVSRAEYLKIVCAVVLRLKCVTSVGMCHDVTITERE